MKINFLKSKLHGYKQSDTSLSLWAKVLGCEVGKRHFSYLGAVIGASPKSSLFWLPLINKISHKMSSYDAASVSMAGRLVIPKAIMESLPIY